MKIDGKEYQALWLDDTIVHFIDQRKLPWRFEVFSARSVDDICYAIKEMVVRGAPAIGVAAAYGMALGHRDPDNSAVLLKSTRPTAYDLFFAVDWMLASLNKGKDAFCSASEYAAEIVNRCKKIGESGERLIKDDMRILTHCNAGALATVDFGTALAPLRQAARRKRKFFVFADETRPRLQGLLTAWELYQEGIPHALIADNAAGYFMSTHQIDMVIVGADRIARNGDFANKIGTYEKAVVAKENSIPFYVAAPLSTFDSTLEDGSCIIIEERSRTELSEINGVAFMPDWVNVKNPAFDVTPKRFVTGYITENGIKKKW